jgi:SAM-dependent methyltransferase
VGSVRTIKEPGALAKTDKKESDARVARLPAGHEAAGDLQGRTIHDFGQQWLAFPEVTGYFGSSALLADVCGPLLGLDEIRGRRVAEIGSGQGRIVEMLLDAGAAHVVGVEPSAAFTVLGRNLERHGSRVSLLKITGERLPPSGDLDLVFSIGVLHHIPDPGPVIHAAREALRPGGRMVIWVYGREGNHLLLFFLLPLRGLTRRLPDPLLRGIVRAIDPAVCLYIALGRLLPVPLWRYFRDVLGRFGPVERRLTVYDQLNPAYARYYRQSEAVALLERAGFTDVRLPPTRLQLDRRRHAALTALSSQTSRACTADPGELWVFTGRRSLGSRGRSPGAAYPNGTGLSKSLRACPPPVVCARRRAGARLCEATVCGNQMRHPAHKSGGLR